VIGTRLGPYEITAKLGEGGMGEVYSATDTRLKRDVAIKVLPVAFVADKERLARFEREAQVLAQLNHPNIAQIYGMETSGESHALVMEFVEGPTLADRLAQGALPLDEAFSIAKQVAEALEEAHEKGIVHRDLKPQNVKAYIEGKAKVLDFGLAKAMEPAGSASSSPPSAADLGRSPTLMNSPTLTGTHGTQLGVILGTAAYMAPEQARGGAVDRRADIWAFGAVAFEMLTGRRLFAGETVSDTLAAVLRAEIDWACLPAATPASIRTLLRRCLERNPKQRLHDIADARIVLEEVLGGRVEEPVGGALARAAAPRAPAWRRFLPWTVAAVAVVAAGLWSLRVPGPAGAGAERPRRIAIGVAAPPAHTLAADDSPVVALSRDGDTLAFVAEGAEGNQIYLRRLDRAEVSPLAGTRGGSHPFFSPDGRSLAYFAEGRIRKVALDGGPPLEIAGVNTCRGATWTDGGWIVFTASFSTGLSKVRDSGGRVEPLTTLDKARGERTHRWPAALPGSPWLLYSVGFVDSPNSYDDARIDALNLETGERKTIFEGAWMARFAPPSTLLLQRRTSLLALRFDPLRAVATGPEQAVLDNAGGDPTSGAGYFAAAAGGTLAYVPVEALVGESEVVIIEPDGRVAALPLPEKRYWYPRFSPDGRRLALDVGTGSGSDDEIWVHDIASGRFSRLSFIAGSAFPSWSRDGAWMAYTGGMQGRVNAVFRKRVDGAAEEERIWQANDVGSVSDWFPDGRALVATDIRGELGLYLVPLGGGEARRLFAAPGGQYGGSFDPSGRFFAYASVETGVDEIFVSTLPEGGGKWQVSDAGGQVPVWSRDGKTIFYMRGDAIWAVDVETTGGFSSGTPREAVRGPYQLRTTPFRNFDAGPGGRLALVRRRTDIAAPRQLEVLLGWEPAPGPDSSR
jgi:serine/threonine-protein kinase